MLVKAPAADRKLLTPNRLALLRAIRTERPGSRYALARRLGRDLKNVQRDLRLLDSSGLAEDEEERIELELAARAGQHRHAVAWPPRVEVQRVRADGTSSDELADPKSAASSGMLHVQSPGSYMSKVSIAGSVAAAYHGG